VNVYSGDNFRAAVIVCSLYLTTESLQFGFGVCSYCRNT